VQKVYISNERESTPEARVLPERPLQATDIPDV
jgi:hypothetical protein